MVRCPQQQHRENIICRRPLSQLWDMFTALRSITQRALRVQTPRIVNMMMFASSTARPVVQRAAAKVTRKAIPERLSVKDTKMKDADKPRGPSLKEVNNRIVAAVKRDDIDTALQTYQEMREKKTPRPDLTTFHFLMTGCARAGRMKRTLKLYNDMKKFGFPADERTLTSLANACAEAQNEQGITQVVEIVRSAEQSGLAPTVVVFNALLKACARHGSIKQAVDLVQWMREVEVLPDTVTFTTLMNVHIAGRQPEMAFSVYDRMNTAGVHADLYTYHALLQAAHKLRRPDIAFEVYDELRNRGLSPNAVTVDMVLRCAEHDSARLEQCEELFEQCLEHGVTRDTRLFDRMMLVFIRGGEPERVEELFQEMQRNHLAPTVETFNALLMACARLRNKQVL